MADDLKLPTDLTLPSKKRNQDSYIDELGRTGLLQYGGWIQEEFLSELQGGRWARVVREMLSNDPVVHAMFSVIEILVRGVDWKVKPGSDDGDGQKNADFVQSCFDDMSQSWKDLVSEILSFLPWGWSYHEVVYKLRQGDQTGNTFVGQDGKTQEVASSKFDDALIGWRKMPIRSQDSLWRWELDEYGGIQGLWQNTLYGSQAFIPIDKSLLFRTSIQKNNPEGRALCRRIYRPWYFKSKIENIEGIGVERDLAGLPHGTMPAAYLSAKASDEQKAMRAQFEKIITNIRNDEQAALITPSDVYPGTHIPQFDVKLLSTAGSRVFDTGKIIERYDTRILMTLMADFLLLGHQKVGSFALHSSKTELFAVGVGGFLDMICDVYNRHAIPKLLRLNGKPTEKQPLLEHGDIETLDLQDLSELVSKVSDTKIPLSDEEQDWILSQAGLAVIPGTRKKLREEADKKAADIARQTAAATNAGAPALNQPGAPGALAPAGGKPVKAKVPVPPETNSEDLTLSE